MRTEEERDEKQCKQQTVSFIRQRHSIPKTTPWVPSGSSATARALPISALLCLVSVRTNPSSSHRAGHPGWGNTLEKCKNPFQI